MDEFQIAILNLKPGDVLFIKPKGDMIFPEVVIEQITDQLIQKIPQGVKLYVCQINVDLAKITPQEDDTISLREEIKNIKQELFELTNGDNI